MDIILRIFQEALGNGISSFFLFAIGLTFVGLLVATRVTPERASTIGYTAPGILTTMGVIGTFVGILIGLLDFDVDNIDASVPQLLDGLKIAFVTSIIGMVSALLWKVIQTALPSVVHDDDSDPIRLLEEIKEENIGIRKAISSEGDSSLVTQVQKLRTEVTDGNKDIIESFKEFAKEISENSVKAIIEALEEVIREFNEKLSEQFGENFKRFNDALGKILEWQKNNRKQIQELTEQFTKTLEGIKAAESSLSQISESAKEIVPMVENIRESIGTLENQATALKSLLQQVAKLGEEARNAMPQIEENINRLTKGFTEKVDQSLQAMTQSVETVEENISELTQNFTAHVTKSLNEMSTAAGEIGETMKKAVEEYAHELKEIASNAQSVITDTAQQIERLIQDSASNFEEHIKSRVDTAMRQFNEAMDDQMERALTGLGQRLGAIAEDIQHRINNMPAMNGKANENRRSQAGE